MIIGHTVKCRNLLFFMCEESVFINFSWLLHKLSPNWPRAGNSSGSISDQALLAAWIYSLFGKVKVIYKHYQKPFPMHTMTKTSRCEACEISFIWAICLREIFCNVLFLFCAKLTSQFTPKYYLKCKKSSW